MSRTQTLPHACYEVELNQEYGQFHTSSFTHSLGDVGDEAIAEIAEPARLPMSCLLRASAPLDFDVCEAFSVDEEFLFELIAGYIRLF